MNLVENKRQNSNSCILGLPVRASLKDLLMKWLPEDERRKEHPRAIGPTRNCHLRQKEAREPAGLSLLVVILKLARNQPS